MRSHFGQGFLSTPSVSGFVPFCHFLQAWEVCWCWPMSPLIHFQQILHCRHSSFSGSGSGERPRWCLPGLGGGLLPGGVTGTLLPWVSFFTLFSPFSFFSFFSLSFLSLLRARPRSASVCTSSLGRLGGAGAAALGVSVARAGSEGAAGAASSSSTSSESELLELLRPSSPGAVIGWVDGHFD
jgi:hypothetical protein